MAQGRGSAEMKAAARVGLQAVLLCFILIQGEVAEAAVYTVGDRSGWTFNTAGWVKGKRFRAGDVLVFKYNPSAHNVVPVSATGYNSCKAPRGAKTYKSGNDRITLARGSNYFICTFPGHCQSGMKIAAIAA